ncbi:hypothetical protein [Kitasatospora sp. NPDC004531]
MNWYGVRCVFKWTATEGPSYEERITLWRASSAEDAIARAEAEAETYAAENSVEYLGFAQSYRMVEGDGAADAPGVGTEVFSLLRDSPLEPDAYLDAYFDSGTERQQ